MNNGSLQIMEETEAKSSILEESEVAQTLNPRKFN